VSISQSKTGVEYPGTDLNEHIYPIPDKAMIGRNNRQFFRQSCRNDESVTKVFKDNPAKGNELHI